jgi:squalene-associated FAD-dependent desaturase
MQRHCIIIGAGFAGSAAAVRLVQSGWRVTLLDARIKAGGRVYSFEDRETGEVIDNGQHLLMGCYHATLRLLDALGTRGLVRPQEAMRVEFIEPMPDDILPPRRAVLDAGRLPGKAGMALGIFGLQGLSLRDKWAALRFAARLQLGLVQAGQRNSETTGELLRRYGQTDALITRLWEPVILATLNTTPHEAAASLFVEVLRQAFFSDREASRLLLPSVGLDAVLKPLSDWLEQRGGRFIHGTAAIIHYSEMNDSKADERTKEKETGMLHASGITTSAGEFIQADCVISAVPPRALAKLLTAEAQTHRALVPLVTTLEQFTFSPIISAYLWFDRSFMNSPFVALLGTPTQWVFNRRAMCDAPEHVVERFAGHVSTTVSAGNNLINASNEAIIQQCLRDIHAAFPQARTAKLLRGRVIKEKLATPLITPSVESIRPPATTPIANFFLAGDWTATKLPATIESASQSGEAAADAVLKAFAMRRLPINEDSNN